jgi:hypothetical protein
MSNVQINPNVECPTVNMTSTKYIFLLPQKLDLGKHYTLSARFLFINSYKNRGCEACIDLAQINPNSITAS